MDVIVDSLDKKQHSAAIFLSTTSDIIDHNTVK